MSRMNKSMFISVGCAGFGLLMAPNKLLGLFFIHLQRDLGASASMASLALGINSSLMYLLGPLEAIIFKKCGARLAVFIGTVFASVGFALSSFMVSAEWIMASFGVFSAFGLGTCNLAWYTMSAQAVPGRLSFVNNMFTTSHAIVAFALAPMVQFLINWYGWRGTLLLTSGVMLNSVPLGMLMTRHYRTIMSKNPAFDENSAFEGKTVTSNGSINSIQLSPDINDNKQGDPPEIKSHSTWEATKRLLKNPFFIVYAFAMAFANMSRISVSLYTVRYAQSTGIAEDKTVWIMTLQELLSVVAGPVAGYFTSFNESSLGKMAIKEQDRSGVRRRMSTTYRSCVSVRRSHILVIFSVLFSISILIPVFFETFAGFLICGVFNGIIVGSIIALPVTVLSDFFESEDLATAQGLRCLLAGIGLVVYPLFVGGLIDWTGSYRPAQYVAALCSLLCAALTTATQMGLSRKTRNKLLKIELNEKF